MNGSVKTEVMIEDMLTAHFTGSTSVPTKYKVGNGTTTPNVGNTTLNNKIPVDNTEQIDDCEATTGWSAGTDSVIATNAVTFKQGTFSLTLSKTGTAGTTMSVDKTTTSLDFTSKDFWTWVYILDITDLVATGTALTIRFGSDNSNYYFLDVDITSLSNGWNYISFNSAGATGTTGSPVIAACDYTYFSFNTDLAADTIVADRIIFDDIKLASTTDYDVPFTVNYPLINSGDLSAETRATLTATQANGSLITEFGEFDASNNLHSHIVFDAESKEEQDIFILIEITKLRNKS